MPSAIPFWKPDPAPEGPTLTGSPTASQTDASGRLLPEGVHGPVIISAQTSGSSPWEYFLVNGRELPGVVEIVTAPALELNIVLSKAEDKDVQIRKILVLKAPTFITRCTLLTPRDWTDWQGFLPVLLPITRPKNRGEVRQVSHPLIQSLGITFAFVVAIKVAQIPKEGAPAAFDVHWQHWWPNTNTGAHGKVNRKIEDPVQTQTVDIADSVPEPQRLSDSLRPTPARNQ